MNFHAYLLLCVFMVHPGPFCRVPVEVGTASGGPVSRGTDQGAFARGWLVFKVWPLQSREWKVVMFRTLNIIEPDVIRMNQIGRYAQLKSHDG